jgi:hypothetical protein
VKDQESCNDLSKNKTFLAIVQNPQMLSNQYVVKFLQIAGELPKEGEH